MQRSLQGSWQFQLDPEGSISVESLNPDREIPVPLPWQAAFPELQQYSGYAWYRRAFDLDAQWLGGELLLTFGAVDYWCQVFVNGQLCGEHEGGHTAFTFNIRQHAKVGANELAVRVYDAATTGMTIHRWPDDAQNSHPTRPPFDPHDVPHGKQEWYINAGGIWQDVTLTAVPTVYLNDVRVVTNIHTGDVEVSVTLAGAVDAGTLHAEVEGLTAQATLSPGQTNYALRLHIPNPRLWSTDAPNLYNLTVRLDTPAGDDERAVRFGFREFIARDGKLWLNGEPFFLLAALDQDLYPGTIYTPPSTEFLRDEFEKAKHLGLNCLRCHIKPPDPRYLDLADEMGLLVWEEIPSWRTFHIRGTVHPAQLEFSEEVKQRATDTLREMIRRDFNHPSVVIWTIVNEDWGTALPLSAADRAWVAEMYDTCKQLDPTRLVVDNSACGGPWSPNIHVKSDLDDFHIYMNVPDNADSFEQFMEQFALRPLWTFSSSGDAQRTGQEPLVLSEFGNWGLPSFKALAGPNGEAPDWFHLGPWWSTWEGEPGWPRDVIERFDRLGLGAIWPDYEAFAAASQWHQYTAMKFEIEAMRRQPTLCGYVITELSDIYWESNGLMDFNRCPKVYHDVFRTVNNEDVLVPQLKNYAYWDDQTINAGMHGAHYSGADWSKAKLRWRLNGTEGESDVPPVARGEVADFGRHQIMLPKVETTRMMQAEFTLRGDNGDELARNALDLLVLPASARQAKYTGKITVLVRPREERASRAAEAVAMSGFVANVASLGYQVDRQLTADTQLIISYYPTMEALQWVREGGMMLYLSAGAGPFFYRQGRSGSYGGGWITSFSWLRPGIYQRLNVPNPVTMPFRHVMPLGAIVGLPYDDPAVQGDFLAGQISGWLHHPAFHTVQFRYGRGRVIQTTYPLMAAIEAEGGDPVGIAMMHDLIDYLTSDACQPTLTANY
jgi:hypothetical protein